MKNLLIILSISVALFTSCENQESILSQSIALLQSPDSLSKQENVVAIHKLLETHINQFPESEKRPAYLLLAAQTSIALKEVQKGLNYYSTFMQENPEHPQKAEALFMTAFVQENALGDLEKAKESYELFALEFPNHELMESVTQSLNHLGKSPEQLLQEFKEKQHISIQDSIIN